MSLLGRKVTATRWHCSPGLAKDEVASDAITKDLRSTENALSFWVASDAHEPWKDAALAMGAAAERLDSLDIACIDREDLAAVGIEVVDSRGETPVADLRDQHVDARNLDGLRLVHIADHVARAVRSNSTRLRRITRRELIAMLVEAVQANRLRLDDLKDCVRKEISVKVAAAEEGSGGE